MLSLLKQCRGNTAQHVWPLSLCRICNGSIFLFFCDSIRVRFLFYPFIISNCPLSASPLLWLCAVTPAVCEPRSNFKGQTLKELATRYRKSPVSHSLKRFWWRRRWRKWRFEISITVLVRVMFYVHSTSHPDPGSNDGLHNKYWPTLVSAFDRKQHGIELLLWLFMHCCLLKVWPCPPALLLIFIDAIYSLQQYT